MEKTGSRERERDTGGLREGREKEEKRRGSGECDGGCRSGEPRLVTLVRVGPNVVRVCVRTRGRQSQRNPLGQY